MSWMPRQYLSLCEQERPERLTIVLFAPHEGFPVCMQSILDIAIIICTDAVRGYIKSASLLFPWKKQVWIRIEMLDPSGSLVEISPPLVSERLHNDGNWEISDGLH